MEKAKNPLNELSNLEDLAYMTRNNNASAKITIVDSFGNAHHNDERFLQGALGIT